jgi:hypothetical protein
MSKMQTARRPSSGRAGLTAGQAGLSAGEALLRPVRALLSAGRAGSGRLTARGSLTFALAGALALVGRAGSAEALESTPLLAASRHSTSLSPGAIAIAAVAGLAVLACAAWGIARWRAIEPRWTQSVRHALTEAGLRASSTWSEFADWLRLGH